MFAVEKIVGITAVEWERLEAGEWSELGGSPLPPISQHAFNPEGAAALGKRIDRRGSPASEIKIAGCRVRSLFSPGIRTLAAVTSAECRALPLGFGGQ